MLYLHDEFLYLFHGALGEVVSVRGDVDVMGRLWSHDVVLPGGTYSAQTLSVM